MIMENKPASSDKRKSKYSPKGMDIMHEDRDIIVVNKTNGLLTIGTGRERIKTAYHILTDYVKKGNPRSRERIFIVHRLDRDTSGLLVFAKNEKAKKFLQDNWKDFTKSYYAVVLGEMEEKEGVVESYLADNSIHRVYSVRNEEEGKYAKTGYKVVRENGRYSLLEVDLFTGRKNQIRVHLADIGHPVAGDKIYGKKNPDIKRLCLHAAALSFVHPFSKKEMHFETRVPSYFLSLVKR